MSVLTDVPMSWPALGMWQVAKAGTAAMLGGLENHRSVGSMRASIDNPR